MNKLLILILGISLIACNQNNKENQKSVETHTELTKKTDNFDWLLGEWKRNNDEVGNATFESWEKKSNTEYLGLGFTMENGDTLLLEKIRLIKKKKNWNLEVQSQDESEPTIFKMTSFTDQKFICENKDLDFPIKLSTGKIRTN